MLPLTKGADDAWSRRATGIDVQLCVAGSAGAGGPPVARDSSDYRPRARAALVALRYAVYQFRPPLDSAGEAVARAPAPSAVHHSQRATADRADRLQPAVSLVRGARDGRRRLGAHHVHEESRPL